MDFRQLRSAASNPAPIEPRKLYQSRPGKAKGYGYLRDVQGQVLEEWHRRRDARDLVVKVNTGAGKTIDGLVILRSYANAGEGPGLYVAPSKYLADQVRKEAAKIDIATTDDPDSSAYRSGDAIGVVNIWRLFTGKSIFRDSRPSGPAPIGSLVIDDAHAAVVEARRALSLLIPRDEPLFAQLLNMFAEDLRQQAPNALMDVTDATYGALARVPFWAWRTKLEQARQLINSHRHDTDALTFAWPAVREVLELCRVVFTGREVSITPLCNPVHLISGFHEAKHRLYLTATLADDSVLVTDFAADPKTVADPVTPVSAGDIGERLILAPMELNPRLAADEVRAGIARMADTRNVVVIVPSALAADVWRLHTNHVVYADDMIGMVTRLRDGHVGLVVLVNKYDGIDLPEDACRVLVLDGLPEAFDPSERVDTSLISRLAGVDDRQVQRIEQGMGRAVRSNEDHCVVFLLGSRLAQLVADPRTLERFGAATQAQLKLSRQAAHQMQDASVADILNTADQVLRRNRDWVETARSVLENIPPARGRVSAAMAARRAAFDRAVTGDYRAAARILSDAVNASDDERERGWLLELQAQYSDKLDPEQAQTILQSAREKNTAVLRPRGGVAYRRLTVSKAQAQAASDFLTANYTTPASLQLAVHALTDDLVFDPDRTPEFEAAFAALAPHIGFDSQRPEQELGEGPDVLWALGDLQYWVIEAKSGATTDFISKHDADQLGGSIRWFRHRYDSSVSVIPVMVHCATSLGTGATEAAGQRIVTVDGLARLNQAVLAFSQGLAAERWDDPDVVGRLLAGHGLRRSDLAHYMRVIQRR